MSRRERCQSNVGQWMKLEGEREISDSLLEKMVGVGQKNVLLYIKWESCTSIHQGLAVDKQWVPNAQGLIAVQYVNQGPSADMSSDLRLHFLLRRRGLAFEQVGLMDSAAHEEWVSRMISELMREPLEGCGKVTVEQLLHADHELYRVMQSQTRHGIRERLDGSRLPEQALRDAMCDPRTAILMGHKLATRGRGGRGQKRGRSQEPGEDNWNRNANTGKSHKDG